MIDAIDEHKFNDDLLLQDADRTLAQEKYPSVFHVLDHLELQDLFREYNSPANLAKRMRLRAGMWAIGLAFTALALAALEILVTHPTDATRYAAALTHTSATAENWAGIALALVSGACGIAGLLIGSVGVWFAPRKRAWLYHRLMAERLRQLHFQTFAFRTPEILASLKDDSAKSEFLSQRKLWLESFKARFIGRLDSAFAATIDPEGEVDPWLHDSAHTRKPIKFLDSKSLDPLFEAYRELRIEHQLDYADYKLHDDNKLFGSKMPRRQLAILLTVSFILIVLLGVLHVGVVVGAVVPDPAFRTVLHSPTIIVAIIWCALAALATRAVEQGLQPEREIERYQQYRSAVRAILERYDEATTQAAKVEVMRQMERLAFDEMRNFLITNDRSRFVM